MPNTAALLGVAQAAAKTGAQILAPSAAAAAGGATVGTAGAVLSAAVPIIGLAAVAAPIVSNLFSCGTLSTIGCVRTNDANAQIAAMLQARQIAYQVELGQITPAQGEAQIQSILNSAPQQFQRPTDWTNAPPTPVDVACGSNGGIPSTAEAAKIDCKTIDSPQQVVSDLLAYVQSVTPPAGTAAASQLAASDPIAAATGVPGWVVLAGAAVAIYLLVQ